MREALERLLDDLTLMTVALAIALGWSLYQVASGVGQLVSTLFLEVPSDLSSGPFGALTWRVGDRVLTFEPLLRGSIELAVVLAVALFVYRRAHRA